MSLHGLPSRARVHPSARRFVIDDQGGIAFTFALLLVPLCLFIGAGVDIGRWAHARHQTIQAMDSAVLAGASVLQSAQDPSAALTLAKATAQRYYAENTITRLPVLEDTIAFDATNDNTAFVATGNAYIKTVFLNIARIPKLPLLDTSEAQYSKAELAGGGPGGGSGPSQDEIEIALMLDVTGSMAGSKVVDMKAAATDLVNIVISDSARARKVRVALVPFAEGVRLPSSANNKARGSPKSKVDLSYSSWGSSGTVRYHRTECVVERTGTNKYTDVAPGTGNYVMTLFNNSGNNGNSGKCGLSAKDELVPLTKDKEALKARIAGLELSGSTAGQIGTGWAWYSLSPNWSSLWPQADNKPKAYGSAVQKIAILMTDGEYNLQYDANGVQTGSQGAGAAANGDSTTQARALCAGMKAKGLTVYTVGFALGGNSTAIETLKKCATDNSTNYTADNGTELKQAFRDIALKISPIYLSH